MTANPALDAAIRQARHLLFAFDGPIRHVEPGKLADSTTPTAAHVHDALSACRESRRSVVVLTPKPQIDVPAYLDAHDLFTQVTLITEWISDASTELKALPADFLLVTSSPADIKAARSAGTPSIGYALTPDDAHLVDAGAITFIYSMSDLALTLRARRLDL